MQAERLSFSMYLATKHMGHMYMKRFKRHGYLFAIIFLPRPWSPLHELEQRVLNTSMQPR